MLVSKEQVTTQQTDANGVVIKKVIPGVRKVIGEYRPSPNHPGDYIITDTEYYIEDGIKKSKPGQKIDWFAYIQASKSSCDLSQIVARYLSGDSAVVNVGNPFYGDVAALPRNVNEVHDLAARTKAGYENLSDEIKGIFGNSFETFYNAVLTNTVNEKIAAYARAKEQVIQKEAAAAAGGEQ